MTTEYLSIISGSLEEVKSVWKEYRCVSAEWIEPKYIRLVIRSSAGVFDEMLGICVFERIFLRIGNTLQHVLSIVPGFDVSVTFYHVGDDLPCVPCADIYVFCEDVLDHCRKAPLTE